MIFFILFNPLRLLSLFLTSPTTSSFDNHNHRANTNQQSYSRSIGTAPHTAQATDHTGCISTRTAANTTSPLWKALSSPGTALGSEASPAPSRRASSAISSSLRWIATLRSKMKRKTVSSSLFFLFLFLFLFLFSPSL